MKHLQLLFLSLGLFWLVAGCNSKSSPSEKNTPQGRIDSIKSIRELPRKCGFITMTDSQKVQFRSLYNDVNEEIERDMESRSVTDVPEMLGFPVAIHVVSQNGRINIPRRRIADGMAQLNATYAKIYLKFNLVVLDSIRANTRLEDLYYGIWNTETDVFFDKYNMKNVINVYLLDNAEDGSYLNGFTYPLDLELKQGRNRDLLCIGMRTVDNGKTLIHEMGHFFTLLHTFNVDGCGGGCPTEELADGSNCSTTGDLICDTPADPADVNYIDVRTCRYYGNIKDQKGVPYRPMINNYMSYYDACCEYQFTTMQYAVMRKIAQNYRHYLKRKIAASPSAPTSPSTTTIKPPQTVTTSPAASTKSQAATTVRANTPPATATRITSKPPTTVKK